MMSVFSRSTLFLLALGVVFLTTAKADARRKRFEQFSVTAYQTSYSDVSLSSGGSQKLQPSIDIELTLRMHTLFNFLLFFNQFSVGTNTDGTDTDDITGVGLGLKIDLPGYFLVAAKRRDSYRRRKKYPVNTFFHGSAIKTDSTTATGFKSTSLSSRYGIGMDIFMFNYVAHISLAAGVYTFEGDSFIYSSGGLGVTF